MFNSDIEMWFMVAFLAIVFCMCGFLWSVVKLGLKYFAAQQGIMKLIALHLVKMGSTPDVVSVVEQLIAANVLQVKVTQSAVDIARKKADAEALNAEMQTFSM